MRTCPCALCGEPMQLSSSSAKSGAAHRACRVEANIRRTCPDCAGQKHSSSKRCRACAAKAATIRTADDTRVQRYQRDLATEGLTLGQRTKLLHRWQAQCRRCFYCPGLAETVDHVVPLVRGGTNYEGNLVPACRSCNSSKAARLLIEWRAGKTAARTRSPRRKPRPRRIEPIKGEQIELFRVCSACGAGHYGTSEYCSNRCQARSRYRLKVGIPVTAKPYEVRAA